MSFVMNMLEDLWSRAIEEYLEIDRKDFKVKWCVVLGGLLDTWARCSVLNNAH